VRFAVSDVIADEGMNDATRADMQAYTGCIAGALTHREFTQALADAGLAGAEIRETHRVHAQAASAIVRAWEAKRTAGMSESGRWKATGANFAPLATVGHS
jgi:arsenite methyltransferase